LHALDRRLPETGFSSLFRQQALASFLDPLLEFSAFGSGGALQFVLFAFEAAQICLGLFPMSEVIGDCAVDLFQGQGGKFCRNVFALHQDRLIDFSSRCPGKSGLEHRHAPVIGWKSLNVSGV
jgi:hypothetical protein